MSARLGLALASALWLVATPALALDPATVSVEGVIPAEGGAGGAPRDRALREAMLEAVLSVSRDYLPPELLQIDEDREWLRDRLRPRAPAYILTYRVDAPLARRAAPDDPEVEEWVLALTATVDVAQVRQYLRESGLLATAGERPSVALRVRRADGAMDGVDALAGFEQFLLRRLEGDGLVVIEPALRPSTLEEPATTLELARALGADLALDVDVRWRERRTGERVVGGTAEVRLRAVRADDGADVARLHFEAPGYHEDAQEALVRALEALSEQVAQNLMQQLDANWEALSRDRGPLSLVLLDVQSLVQVEAVRDSLAGALGAEEIELVGLGPRTARLRLASPLSPGALADRLAALLFDGFRLEPIETTRRRVALRVESLPVPPRGERAGRPGREGLRGGASEIDTRYRN